MSIISRPDSPVWNYDFKLNGIRHRGKTQYALDFPNGDRNKKGPNAKLAKDVESAKKVELRQQNAQGVSATGTKVTFAAVIAEYKVSKEKLAKRAAERLEGHRAERIMGTYDTLVIDLDRIASYFAACNPPIQYMSQITKDVMTGLIEWRSDHTRWDRPGERRVTNATVNRTVTAVLRGLFTWLEDTKSITFPTKPKWSKFLLKEPKERIRELNHDEEVALIETFDPDYDQWRQFQLRSGMRLENTLLKWSEVDLRKAQATVFVKGDKSQVIPLTPGAVAILKGRIGHHPVYVFTFVSKRTVSYTANGFYYSFVKGERYPISYQGSQSYFKRARGRAAKQVGSLISKDGRTTFRNHDLRHTCASRFLRSSGDLKKTSMMLGHADIKTTMKYAHVHDDELRAAMALAEQENPLPVVAIPETAEKKIVRDGIADLRHEVATAMIKKAVA